MMWITQDEALSLFRKWEQERPLVVCHQVFSDFTARLQGRIISVSDVEVDLFSETGTSELKLRVRPDLQFWYCDDRDLPEDVQGVSVCGLVAVVSPVTNPSTPGQVCFLESLPEPDRYTRREGTGQVEEILGK